MRFPLHTLKNIEMDLTLNYAKSENRRNRDYRDSNQKVYVNDLPKTKVAFDVILEVELVIKEADYHYDESDTCNLWIRVPCEGDLLIHVSDWEINEEGVEQYFKRIFPAVACLILLYHIFLHVN